MGDAFEAWWASDEADAVAEPSDMERLARAAWDAATERAAAVADEYASQRRRLDEQWTAEDVAARIRGGDTQ